MEDSTAGFTAEFTTDFPTTPDNDIVTEQKYYVDEYANAIATEVAVFLKFYGPMFVVVIGITGNILSFVIMSKPKFRNATTCMYMRVLAIGDSMYLITFFAQRCLLGWYLREWLNVRGALGPVCKQFLFCWKMFSVFPRYMLVVMTYDRLIAVAWPLKSRSLSTKRAVIISTSIILIWSAGEALPFAFAKFSPRYSHWLCPYHVDGFFQDFRIAYENFSTATCCALLLLANFIILIILRKSSRKREEMQGGRKAKDEKEKAKDEAAKAQNRQISFMLITVSTVFICLNVPREFDTQFWPHAPPHISANFGFKYMSLEMQVFFESLAYSTNFFLYVITCAKFREALRELFGCESKASGDNNSTISTTGSKISTVSD